MNEMNNLQKALIRVYDEDPVFAPDQIQEFATEPVPAFAADRRSEFTAEPVPAFASGSVRTAGRPRLRRTVLVAALIAVLLVMTTVTTIGVMRAQIDYDIDKAQESWDIDFERNAESQQLKVFRAVDPAVPEEFELIDEDRAPMYLWQQYRDGEGHELFITQATPENMSVSIDAEGEDLHEEGFMGQHAVVYHDEDSHIILLEDGKYIYMIEGDCDYKVIYNIALQLTKHK